MEQVDWRPKLDGLALKPIEYYRAVWLERTFEENDVYEVVRKMAKDKASGPDGFTIAFFQTYWVW